MTEKYIDPSHLNSLEFYILFWQLYTEMWKFLKGRKFAIDRRVENRQILNFYLALFFIGQANFKISYKFKNEVFIISRIHCALKFSAQSIKH